MNLTAENIKQRQQLCKELEGFCREDYSILEVVMDEFVYRLNDKEVEEYRTLCENEFRSNCMEKFIPGFHD